MSASNSSSAAPTRRSIRPSTTVETRCVCGPTPCRRRSRLDRPHPNAGVPESVTRLKRRILLADDDPGLRRLIGTTLGTEDFDVLHAVDGEEALRIARQQHPELVLLDVNMPKIDGFQVCRSLKTDPTTASIKIVMITARATDDDRARGREAGADDYFIKPF